MFRGFVTNSVNALVLLVSATATLTIGAAQEGDGCFDPATSPFDPADWSYCQKIPSEDQDIYMYYTPLEDAVLVGFHALHDTDGWSALGINGNGGMKGANFIVVREDNGEWIAEDRFAMDYVMPTLDKQQDVKLLFAQQENGQTAWGVAIPQNSCDSEGNDYEILDRMTSMLWAVGSTHTFGFHAKRGQFQANLMRAPKEPRSIADDLSYVEFLMPNVTVVMGDGGDDPTNPYICSYFDLEEIGPSMGISPEQTVHVNRFSAVLSPDTKQYIHHMILYSCSFDDESGEEAEHLKIISECTSMPHGCDEMKWPWAVGAGDFIFPNNIGLPIGGEGNRFLLLQMHYYNPDLKEDIIDSSGVRVFYTADLLEQEAGIMNLIGAVDSWQHDPLPAGKERVSLSFAAPSECTQSIWTEPINILGVAHHLHTYGTYQEINIVRDGVNLGNLRPEFHYDFMHQNMDEPIPALRQLLPGDQITQTCLYNTTNAPGDVEFGEFTHQEMCFTAIYYYPVNMNSSSLGSMPLWLNSSWCLEPANNEEFRDANLSLCAQMLYENVPEFFGFMFPEVESTFDLLTACNGGDSFEDLLYELPYLCPECQATASCTPEELTLHAQGVCAVSCIESAGVTLYPDLNDTEPFQYGNWACPQNYYDIPSIPVAPVCQAKGISSIDAVEVNDIVLLDIDNTPVTETSPGNAEDNTVPIEDIAAGLSGTAPSVNEALENSAGNKVQFQFAFLSICSVVAILFM